MIKDQHGDIQEYFSVVWVGDEAPHLAVTPNDPKHQSFWEFATLLLVLMVWGDRFTTLFVDILGDNTAALSNALSLRSRPI